MRVHGGNWSQARVAMAGYIISFSFSEVVIFKNIHAPSLSSIFHTTF
jgi:hypothetical protein